jgi:hypothetical protein
MYPKIWLINVLLAALVSFLGVETYKVWSRGEPTRAAVTDAETAKPEPEKRTVKRVAPPESAYEVVAEKNLFSPKRSEPEAELTAAETPVAVPQPKVPGAKIYLSGVVIADDYKAALVSNAVKKPNEKSERWVREGDSFGGFEVAEIRKDGVILSEGSQKYEIQLYDNSKPRSRQPVKKDENPTVIMTGGDEKASRPAAPGRQTTPAVAAKPKTPPPAAASRNPLQRLIREKNPATADTATAAARPGAISSEKKTALNNLLEVFGNITKRAQ